MTVPVFLFIFFLAIIVSLDAKVSKCYEKKEDGFVVESNCTSPLDEFCAKTVCNVNGTVKVTNWACANEELCNDRQNGNCTCFPCFGELCNGDQLPQPPTTPPKNTTATMMTAEDPAAEGNGMLGIGR